MISLPTLSQAGIDRDLTGQWKGLSEPFDQGLVTRAAVLRTYHHNKTAESTMGYIWEPDFDDATVPSQQFLIRVINRGGSDICRRFLLDTHQQALTNSSIYARIGYGMPSTSATFSGDAGGEV